MIKNYSIIFRKFKSTNMCKTHKKIAIHKICSNINIEVKMECNCTCKKQLEDLEFLKSKRKKELKDAMVQLSILTSALIIFMSFFTYQEITKPKTYVYIERGNIGIKK